ncbi:tripartite motif containing 101 isoform X2 [Tachysurus vachellii]|uniref:tripartite motif containing 101 isoform X2 n=1 Tax=Tachysurus vachellii TaxID=175792 RepID=UPI00296B335E|nr:tripartite motif containing 101 isoform X2 [Tachysurus vachellii]
MSLPLDLSSFNKDASLGTLEKQLICPICLEVFTKPVVILPCQHNLCRKCANELYQVGIGGRFRCPSCRHEVVLDRHGVYGLQRNLLVENIIDVYKQASASCRPPPKPLAQINCEEHEGEKLNIYCITCQIPTCSLCKVFGAHKSCQVAPICDVYQQQKTELSGGIGSLVATNERIQACVNDLEEICRRIEENSGNQKQILCEKFDRLCGILEERRKIMLQRITYEHDEKTSWAQSLVHTYSEHVDTNSKLMQTALNAMEEPEMAGFLQTSKSLIEQVSEATKSVPLETLQPGYENMDHYKVDFNAEERALYQLDFIKPEEEVEEPPEEPTPEPEPEVLPEPEPEPEHTTVYSPIDSSELDQELKLENYEIKTVLSQTKEENQAQAEGCSARQKSGICEKTGLNTQQGQTELVYEGHDSGIHCLTSEAGAETKLFPAWLTLNNRPMLNQNHTTTLDSWDIPENTPKLMSEPSGQFQQTETPLSVWMSGSLMPLSNENQPELGSPLESNQPNMSEVDKNICCELACGAANKESMASVSPQNAASDLSEVGVSSPAVTSESVRISFSFSWLNPLAKKK